jgi:hypothetical protein
MIVEDYRIKDIFDGLQKYMDDDVFDRFRDAEFFRYSPDQRIAVLMGWDRLMDQETKLTRDHAELIAKRRELVAMHQLLERGGR